MKIIAKKLKRMVEVGMPVIKIAKHFGVTRQAVYVQIKRHGIVSPLEVKERKVERLMEKLT